MRYLRHIKSGELVECQVCEASNNGETVSIKGMRFHVASYKRLGFELVPEEIKAEPLKLKGIIGFAPKYMFPRNIIEKMDSGTNFKYTLEEIIK